jgi:hypothetical protein
MPMSMSMLSLRVRSICVWETVGDWTGVVVVMDLREVAVGEEAVMVVVLSLVFLSLIQKDH